MHRFERTPLWQRSLGEQDVENKDAKREREELRQAYYKFRERISILVGEIPQDLRDFTVHDISHIDALWEMADLIAGPDYVLTPTEAFILGGAFLIHDAGMALASYPDGIETLKEDPYWRDCVAAFERRKEYSSEIEAVPNDDALSEAEIIAKVLRERHARQAQVLTSQVWHLQSGDTFRLIEDTDLRVTYGPLIGLIAHSHWWPIDRLAREFTHKLGAPGRYVNQWDVDPLKIACLLRVADAAHLDDRRAPGYLRALRQPSGVADDHWNFQSKMLQPQILAGANLLMYTVRSPFTVSETSSWWTCYETLNGTIDQELRGVDRLLVSTNRPRFAAHGVYGAESPMHLSECIGTDGWEPVNTQLKVTDVAGLVETLGGRELYGDNPHAPLRELIQNAADAIRSRRLLENRAPDWGNIVVRLGRDEEGEWLEVEDNGIGMSTAVLTGPLLDFGQSFWSSDLALRELPGLNAQGFAPTGRYGIGFFSIFMIGGHVRVTTRRYDEAQISTKILEFDSGLGTRPILQHSAAENVMIDGGTRVRIWLNTESTSPGGLLYERPIFGPHWSLKALCAWLCPTLDVTLLTQENEGRAELAVSCSDWLIIPSRDLIVRLLGNINQSSEEYMENVDGAGGNLRFVTNQSGEIVGRICIFNRHGDIHHMYNKAIITVGGIRTGEARGLAGVLTGINKRASRDVATPYAKVTDLRDWVQEQTRLLTLAPFKISDMDDCAQIVRILGGATGDLKIASHQMGWMSAREIQEKFDQSEEVLITTFSLDFYFRKMQFVDSLLRVDSLYSHSLVSEFLLKDQWPEPILPPVPQFNQLWPGLAGAIVEALATAWSVSLEEIASVSTIESIDPDEGGRGEWRRVGTDGEDDVWGWCNVIRNPNFV